MAEPIRKPVHRPRPPHPHAVLVRSRLLPKDPETILPRPAPPPARPALVPPPEQAAQPAAEPVVRRPAVFVPQDETLVVPRVSDERSARSLLLAALALHLGVLLTTWLGQASLDLGPADLLLSGTVLLSGGVMLVLGNRR